MVAMSSRSTAPIRKTPWSTRQPSARAFNVSNERMPAAAAARSPDLVEVIQHLSLARNLATGQEIVRRSARQLTGADGATCVLRDGDKCHYADEDAITPLWKGQRFPMSAGISGWEMLHRQPAVIE